MMLYVPFEAVTNWHIQMLEKSLAAAPLYERMSIEQMLRKLRDKDTMLFEIPHGIIAVEIREGGQERRLAIAAFHSTKFGAHARGIINDMKRLAVEWKCDKIETCSYSKTLMGVLALLGAHIESVNMVMTVETGHGQQDDNQHYLEFNPDGRTT
jgi:hypothetical protein